MYTYDDSDAICKAYGAELASYYDVETAYEDGAEWCSYGWSKNQLALYPTQKKTYLTPFSNTKNKNVPQSKTSIKITAGLFPSASD